MCEVLELRGKHCVLCVHDGIMDTIISENSLSSCAADVIEGAWGRLQEHSRAQSCEGF